VATSTLRVPDVLMHIFCRFFVWKLETHGADTMRRHGAIRVGVLFHEANEKQADGGVLAPHNRIKNRTAAAVTSSCGGFGAKQGVPLLQGSPARAAACFEVWMHAGDRLHRIGQDAGQNPQKSLLEERQCELCQEVHIRSRALFTFRTSDPGEDARIVKHRPRDLDKLVSPMSLGQPYVPSDTFGVLSFLRSRTENLALAPGSGRKQRAKPDARKITLERTSRNP